MQAAIEQLDRLSDDRHTEGIAATDIEMLDTQIHAIMAVSVPMQAKITEYRWHSILPRNIRRMIVEAVARHLWQQGTHPACIRLSRRNALWARLLVGPEYRIHLRADATLDNSTIVCEGAEMWSR